MLETLPLGIVLVGSEDVVRYSNKEKHPEALLGVRVGGKVQEYYPPESVDAVNQILHDFKSGGKDSGEFRIDIEDKGIHIKYFAVRDSAGQYLGYLEVEQEITGG